MNLKPSGETFLFCALIGIFLVLLFPLPPTLLDALLALNLLLSVMTLFLTLQVKTPLEFNTFPSLLLLLTFFRLALNIASTRLILGNGSAGKIIETFGVFVTGGDLLIGCVIFALLTLINFIVITKGAGRIAEVAARFTLEALPGKQTALDAEATGGVLTPSEVKEARIKLQAESEFYGSMDGASKFVRGDAIAGIVITLVNGVGGCLMAAFASQDVTHYLNLSIGDGLVTQIPALFISLGGAIMVSRTSSGHFAKTLLSQLFGSKSVVKMSAFALIALSLLPGMPKVVMFALALPLLAFSFWKTEPEQAVESKQEEESTSCLELFLGMRQLNLAEPLLAGFGELRDKIAHEYLLSLPSIHISDNLSLPPENILLRVKGRTLFSGKGEDLESVQKIINQKIENSLHELVGRGDVLSMLERAKKVDCAVVEEIYPHKASLGDLLKVIQNLLKEGFPIRDFVTILETIADHLPKGTSFDASLLTEVVRQKLRARMLENFVGVEGTLHAIVLDPKLEQMLASSIKKSGSALQLSLRPSVFVKMEQELLPFLEKARDEKLKSALLTSPAIRGALSDLLARHEIKVLSYEEVEGSCEVKVLGSISPEVLIG